ncbi:adhesion G-protein coupled receptor F3-like [Ambystoma mexicanum]|uniref:adhesion G-protein coupled receptor F3-like n=1 Tax=Ambystoma mexicanum TaxID=8296 RepID=UPI0037E8AFC1
MITLLVSTIYCMEIIQPSSSFWDQAYKQNFSIDPKYDAMDDDHLRSKRALAASENMYRYVYYSDLLLDGSSAALAASYLQNISSLPVNFTVKGVTSFLSITSVEVTTMCNVTDGIKTCECNDGFFWNISVCFFYPSCNFTAPCACVVVTDDSIPICEEPFSGPINPVNMTGYFILNQTYTTFLADGKSEQYKDLQFNVTGALIKGYAGNSQLMNVTILGFRPRIPMHEEKGQVFPLMIHTAAIRGRMVLIDGYDDEGRQWCAVIAIEEAYRLTDITNDGLFEEQADMGETLVEVGLTFWVKIIKREVPQRMMLAQNHPEYFDDDMAQNAKKAIGMKIMIDVKPGWKPKDLTDEEIRDFVKARTYVCQFYLGSVVHEDKKDIQVVLLPAEIIRSPIQQSVRSKNGSLLLECCIQDDGESYTVDWSYASEKKPAVQGPRTDLKCYQLATPAPEDDTIYTCRFTNPCDQEKTHSIPIAVIKDKFCERDENGWDITKAGISSTINCPSDKIGNMTRNCSSNGVWLQIVDNCISKQLKAALDNVAILQQGLGSSQERVPQIIGAISTSNSSPITNGAEVNAMVKILGKISDVSSTGNNTFGTNVVKNFLSVAGEITGSSYASTLSNGQGPPASGMLKSVETFSQLLKTDNQTFDIELPSIQLKGSSFDTGCDLSAYQKTFNMNLTVSMFIDEGTIANLSNQGNLTITSVAYATMGNLLPMNPGKFENSQMNSIVQSTSIKINNLNTNISDFGGINMTFSINSTHARMVQHCVFWDFSLPPAGVGGWSDAGCVGWSDENFTYCTCNHLTSFAVLMSINPEPLFLVDEITYAGLGVSIVSLFICLTMEWLVWKYVARSNISYFRHTALVNIAFSLLCADICFLAASFPSVKGRKFICLSITFLNHFFYLSLFFWTLCQSMMLLHQLVFVFHHLRKKVFLSLSFCLGYVFPAGISAGTFLYFYPRDRYTHQSICWLNPDSGAILTFAIPAGSIIVINFLTLIVVISKLMRPSVSDASHSEDKETAKSIMKAILVLTPVFGLTWVFGFALLKDLDPLTKKVFTYGFAGMNAFQGFFILVTTCFTEKKVRDAFSKRMGSTPSTVSTSEAPTKMTYSNSLKK